MSGGFWFNYFLALLVVALMLLGLWVVVRGLSRGRIFASASRRMVTVLESTMLSQHVAVHVVKVGQRYLLVGGGNNGSLSTLAELPPEEVDAWLAAQRESLGKTGWLGVVGSLRGRP
jgi:flagellar biogenesis protein FliO